MTRISMLFSAALALCAAAADAGEIKFEAGGARAPEITAAALAQLPAIAVPVPLEPVMAQDKTVRATQNYTLHLGTQDESKAFLAKIVGKLKSAGCVVINERVVIIPYTNPEYPEYRWGINVDYIGPAIEHYITAKNALYTSRPAALADVPNITRNLEAAGYVVLNSGVGVYATSSGYNNNAWRVYMDYIKSSPK